MPSLFNIKLEEIEYGLGHGTFSSAQLVKAYLTRIEETNDTFCAVIETNPDALTIAQRLDAEMECSGRRGPLHGVPVLLKDNVVTLDSMQSSSGSHVLVSSRPAKEAAVVTALRKAGAIILGKENLAEWVGLRTSHGTTGWSPRGGQATGIFYPRMKASGSSTGSAIATSLGLAFASFGTETVSSIVSPAEKSAVVGFKPSKGLIPSAGIIYGSQQQDTVGLFTRNVRDAARILEEILRHTSDHETSANKVLQNIDNAPASCDTNLSHVRIGIPGDIGVLLDISKVKREAFEETLSLLKEAGAEVVRNVSIAGAKEYEDLPQASKQIILDTDLKLSIDFYLSTLQSNPHKLKRLEDVIEVTKRIEAEKYPERDVGGFERAAKTDPEDELYKSMVERDKYFVQEGGIAGAMVRHNLNVLLMPTASMTMSTFAAKAGSPVMSVPMGFFPDGTKVEHDPRNGFVNVAPNIPFALYIFSKAHADEDVIRVGHVFEQLSKVRERARPYMMPRTDLSDIVKS